jgi:hypothetical protein
MDWTVNSVVLILGLFVVKHFIADFPLQYPRHYTVKGTYGQWGGIEHALIHGAFTAVILSVFVPIDLVLQMAAIDVLVHYHIDWAKMNVNRHFGWGPLTHEEFWVALGVDQLLHYLTYIGIVYYLCLI